MSGVVVSCSQAQNWLVRPSLEVDQSFTDNARLERRGREEWDTITTVTPAVSIRGAGARVTLDLDASIDALQYWRDQDLSSIQPQLAGGGTIAFVPDLLFLDARASVEQVARDAGQAVSGSDRTSQLGTTIAAYQMSPYLRNHFGSFADSQLRYSFSQVFSSSSDLEDATAHELNATVVSGKSFSRLGWRLTADGLESEQGSGDASAAHSVSTRLVSADVDYRVRRQLSLLASVGYERIEDKTLDDQPDGPIGSFGFRLTPGPRTTLVVMYNHRFDKDFASGELDYKVSETGRFRVSYTEGIQTSQTLLVDNLSALSVDESGNFIDARTAKLFALDDAGLGLTNAAFRQKRLDASFGIALGRNAIDAAAYYDSRFTDSTDVEDVAFGGSVSWHHALDPRSELGLTGRFREVDFGDRAGRVDDLFGAQVSLSHRLSESLEGVAVYNYTNRLSTDSDNDFVENVFTVGLQKSF
jgi:uncharacterized protein (PEP-CTERM system associated)